MVDINKTTNGYHSSHISHPLSYKSSLRAARNSINETNQVY